MRTPRRTSAVSSSLPPCFVPHVMDPRKFRQVLRHPRLRLLLSTSRGSFAICFNNRSATLTFVADASCTSLPPSVRARSYSAVLSPMPSNAWAMKTVLSGTDFYDGLDSMFVGRNRDGLWFGVYSWDAVERWLEEYP